MRDKIEDVLGTGWEAKMKSQKVLYTCPVCNKTGFSGYCDNPECDFEGCHFPGNGIAEYWTRSSKWVEKNRPEILFLGGDPLNVIELGAAVTLKGGTQNSWVFIGWGEHNEHLWLARPHDNPVAQRRGPYTLRVPRERIHSFANVERYQTAVVLP